MTDQNPEVAVIIDIVPGGWAPLTHERLDFDAEQTFRRQLCAVTPDVHVELWQLSDLHEAGLSLKALAGMVTSQHRTNCHAVLIVSQERDEVLTEAAMHVLELLPDAIVSGLNASVYEKSHHMV